jgi:hypothetical protein
MPRLTIDFKQPFDMLAETVDAFSRMTCLGEGLVASGRLSPMAIERTIAALRLWSRRSVAPAESHRTRGKPRAVRRDRQ